MSVYIGLYNETHPSVQALLLRRRRHAAAAAARGAPPLRVPLHQLYALVRLPVQLVLVPQQQRVLVLDAQQSEHLGVEVAQGEEADGKDEEGGVDGEGRAEEGDGGHVRHDV